MRQQEISEIQRRASIVAGSSIDALHTDLRALHARNAAKGCLRSGATIKESGRIACAVARGYFGQLETYIRELPGGRPGTDAVIVDAISESTSKLLGELWVSLRKTAALASDEKLVVHIQPKVEAELSAAQEEFRSNLRAYWASREAPHPREARLLLALELASFAVALTLAVVWVFNPAGPYEAWVALFGMGGVGVELYRRKARAGAP